MLKQKKIKYFSYDFNCAYEYMVYQYAIKPTRKLKRKVKDEDKCSTRTEIVARLIKKYRYISFNSLNDVYCFFSYKTRAYNKIGGLLSGTTVPLVCLLISVAIPFFVPDSARYIFGLFLSVFLFGQITKIQNECKDHAMKQLMFEDYSEIIKNMIEKEELRVI